MRYPAREYQPDPVVAHTALAPREPSPHPPDHDRHADATTHALLDKPTPISVQAATARVALDAPSALRGGLMWPARVTIRARTRVVEPQVVLGAGYVRGMQLNAIEPAPTDETTRGRSLALTYATLQPGDELTIYLQLQVNPDTLGRQDLSVVLEPGGDDPPAPVRLPASATVLP